MTVRILKNFLTRADIEQLLLFSEQNDFEPGRQGTGYMKARIPRALFPELREDSLSALGVPVHSAHDCYLVRYDVGNWIGPHDDPAPPGFDHHRLNAIVSVAEGGQLVVEGEPIQLGIGDGYVFRPDLQKHEVTKVTAGTRMIWSVGVLVAARGAPL